MADRRTDPENLLQVVQKLERQQARGRLRVFLGMCPGVGKTYSMLKAARVQQSRGVNVVIGVVETHGRKETEELVVGLTIIPKKKIDYKNSNLEEMDLDAILNLKPQLVLVDELAHTNAPGARHRKRHQDVEEILDAGIDVCTTINIQHIESRNDQVAQITNIIVRETVPDSILENADQIEVVDLSPRELLQRLHEGKVYLGERAEQAKQNFFKEERLTALRELALRFTAEKVDQDLNEQMTVKGIEGPWNTNERLLVAISQSPYSSRLIRATRRMAYNLEAPWVALYVDTGEILNKEDQEMLQKNIALARELDAEIVTTSDTSLSHAIQKVCQERNVTQIVMGRPDRRFIKDFITGGTLLDQLVRTTSKIDVHVIRADRKPRYRGFHLTWLQVKTSWIAYYYTSWFLAGVSVISYALMDFVGYRSLGSVFLLSILLVASISSRGPILYAAVFSALVWDYFFIPPQFTFYVRSREDFMMLCTFFVTAIVGGYLTTKIRRQEEVLQSREERASNLYELGKKISSVNTVSEIADILTTIITKQFGGEAYILFLNKDLRLEITHDIKSNVSENEIAVAEWVRTNKKPAGWSTPTLSGAKVLCLPMKGKAGIIGVLVYFPDKKIKTLTIEQEYFLESVLAHTSIAIERFIFSEEAQTAKLYEASEKLHQTLLNSVSHELRTPITAIIGTSTALKDENTILNEKSREALTDELVNTARRLDRVVENLLDMSRLQKGALQLKREWFAAQDLISESINELKNESKDRAIDVSGDLNTLIEGDFRLLKHALDNLLLNALRYSSAQSRIAIHVKLESSRVKILVKDNGKGIPDDSRELVFEKFFRLPGTPAGGLGLGLSIVKNIVDLHDGLVAAHNREDQDGAVFEIQLPYKTPPQELKEFV